jgi:hypothetical protein
MAAPKEAQKNNRYISTQEVTMDKEYYVTPYISSESKAKGG